METDSLADGSSNSDVSKKRRINSSNKSLEETAIEHNKWLSNMPVNNLFSILTEMEDESTVNASEIYRKLTLALKEKNANFYTLLTEEE